MLTVHLVEGIAFTRSRMLMTVDGERYSVAFADVSDRLARASVVEREKCEVSPSGYGIHWPLVDEDLTVDGLLTLARHEAGLYDVSTGSIARKARAVAEGRTRYKTEQERTLSHPKNSRQVSARQNATP
jgi:hypothetical protein